MGKVEQIEKDIQSLDDQNFAAFRAWFLEYDQSRWDRQITADAEAGKLDALVQEALTEYDRGASRPL